MHATLLQYSITGDFHIILLLPTSFAQLNVILSDCNVHN